MIGQGHVYSTTGGTVGTGQRSTHDGDGRLIVCTAALSGRCALPAGHYGPHVLAPHRDTGSPAHGVPDALARPLGPGSRR